MRKTFTQWCVSAAFCANILCPTWSIAQTKNTIKTHISKLSGTNMEGRGYVKNADKKAAKYIRDHFERFQLKSFDDDYYQPFFLSVNTFPNRMLLGTKKQALEPGVDYLVYPSTPSVNFGPLKVQKIDLSKLDSAGLKERVKKISYRKFYLLENYEAFLKQNKWSRKDLVTALPKGYYGLHQSESKLVWPVATYTTPAALFYISKDIPSKKLKRVQAFVDAEFIPNYKTQNVIGYVEGTVYPDSFVVFTAHYDHVGKMGYDTRFPGANDNASGTGCLLYLAEYFSKNPQPYSIAFMAMGAEEAGLLGSKHYTEYPLFPLQNIKFLTNLDMLGDATKGITVVNGESFPSFVNFIDSINKRKALVPEIKSRGESANSDHHPFYEKGVSAVFIYTNGGSGHYHDIFDTAKSLQLTGVNDVMNLIIQYTELGAKRHFNFPRQTKSN
jgi:aminopeptidase YwaD